MKSILLTLSVSLYLATYNAATAQQVPSSIVAHPVNGIASATTFPGSDIGAKVNAAAEQVIGGDATSSGCSGSYMNLALFVNGAETADLYGNRNPNAPVTFTLRAASTVYLSFQYNQWTFPPNSYAVWYAPQIEPGNTMTAYKQSLWGISPQRIVQVGTPSAGQAACIKSVGPPVTLGSCSTQPTSTGSCVCN